ncbi:MAG: response regulator transcription factor [Muribaculum sp.]|nr:response regulator transcription factor [Muribaculum sp.]
MDKYRILLVEDDNEIRNGVEIYLKNQGYEVLQAANGKEGLALVRQTNAQGRGTRAEAHGEIRGEHNGEAHGEIHLAIVDIMMPVMDGVTMLMQLRAEGYEFPVIMLSAKSEEVDKIMGLNMGADDYVTKPFTPLELLARVNSQLRRYAKYLNAVKREDNEHIYRIGGLELNEDTVEVTVDDEPVKLTPMEFKIVQLLIKNAGRVFSADEIYERVWNEKAVNTDTIMVHVRNIREKIELDPKNPKYLKVVWGVGYKIEKQ